MAERTVNFRTFTRLGSEPDEGCKTIHAKANWVMRGEEGNPGYADIFGLGDPPQPGDVIYIQVGRLYRYMRVKEVEELNEPSNYHWRAYTAFGGGFNPGALSQLKVSKT